MQEIIKYVADDGTEFEDEAECLDYEREMLLTDFSNRGLKAFDYDKRELPIENYQRIEDLFDNACFCIIPNEIKDKLAEIIRDNYQFDPFPNRILDSKDDENLFYWDEDTNLWKNYKHELAKLLELGQGLV